MVDDGVHRIVYEGSRLVNTINVIQKILDPSLCINRLDCRKHSNPFYRWLYMFIREFFQKAWEYLRILCSWMHFCSAANTLMANRCSLRARVSLFPVIGCCQDIFNKGRFPVALFFDSHSFLWYIDFHVSVDRHNYLITSFLTES